MVDVSQSANTKETHIQQKVDEILFAKRQFYYILIWRMEYSGICAPLLICKFDFLLSGLALVPDRDIRKRLFIEHFTIHKNSIFPSAFIRMEYNRKCFYRWFVHRMKFNKLSIRFFFIGKSTQIYGIACIWQTFRFVDFFMHFWFIDPVRGLRNTFYYGRYQFLDYRIQFWTSTSLKKWRKTLKMEREILKIFKINLQTLYIFKFVETEQKVNRNSDRWRPIGLETFQKQCSSVFVCIAAAYLHAVVRQHWKLFKCTTGLSLGYTTSDAICYFCHEVFLQLYYSKSLISSLHSTRFFTCLNFGNIYDSGYSFFLLNC